ncbi:maleylacetate reductase [Tabrizicola sp.]|uniref:maleylacetate reductase n=1 Tax=Tabrizicola sp. TaxID=2005166 RepID=UPI002735A20F|nr:maleylacetate reductase [Tabrizicola sp.]MDP3195650.1 maleylacetate reductase [Tabrizicola sp.]
MTRAFTFPGLTTRVVFGHGTLTQVPDEVARLGRSRAMVLSTPHQQAEAQALAERLGAKAAGIFAGATMHTPVDVTDRAIAAYRAANADCVVSLGGGSTTGLGKAIAVRTGADQVVIPTTYAGSEMTDILGETAAGEKTTRRDPAIRPEVVIYDVDLTLTLPLALTVTSALNAIAHAMEGFYAPDRNPVTESLSRDAMPAFRDALPALAQNPQDKEARAKALFAAWGCSLTLGQVTMALHHKLAHVLGGSFGLPHAETHAVLLPHTTAYNEPAVGSLLLPISNTFGHGSAGKGLWHFAKSVDAPMRLADLGLTAQDLDRAADIATKNPYANPHPVTRDGIRHLLQQAFDGHCPD